MSDRIKPRAALFDIDGTLIDSNAFHAEAWSRAIAQFGRDVPVDEIRGQIGKGGDMLLPALLPADFLAEHQEALEAYRTKLFADDYLGRIRPFPSVRELFERVRAAGIRIVLASSGVEDEVAHHVELIGCADLIEARTTGDDVARSKPHPDIFAAALKALGDVEAGEAVVIGDSPYDMQAARALGIPTIGVRCGGFADDVLTEAGADALFDDPADLLARFDESVLGR